MKRSSDEGKTLKELEENKKKSRDRWKNKRDPGNDIYSTTPFGLEATAESSQRFQFKKKKRNEVLCPLFLLLLRSIAQREKEREKTRFS